MSENQISSSECWSDNETGIDQRLFLEWSLDQFSLSNYRILPKKIAEQYNSSVWFIIRPFRDRFLCENFVEHRSKGHFFIVWLVQKWKSKMAPVSRRALSVRWHPTPFKRLFWGVRPNQGKFRCSFESRFWVWAKFSPKKWERRPARIGCRLELWPLQDFLVV